MRIKRFVLFTFVLIAFGLCSCDKEEPENSSIEVIPSSESTTTDVTEDSLSNIRFMDAIFTYDGQEHSLEIEGTLPAGITVEYVGNSQTNVGEYEVKAVFADTTGIYNNLPELKATLTIQKAKYDMSNIKFENKTYIYDGQEHSLEIEGTLPTGVTVSYSTNKLTSIGSINVTATFSGDYENYNIIPEMSATLTIQCNPKEALIISSGNIAFNNYDGYIALDNSETTFRVYNEIEVSPGAKWVLSSDICGAVQVLSKTVSLDVGNNNFYIIVTSNDESVVETYSITIRRKPVYSVYLTNQNDDLIDTLHIQEDEYFDQEKLAQAIPSGYTLNKCQINGVDLAVPYQIKDNVTIELTITPNTNTKYTVNHYQQKLDGTYDSVPTVVEYLYGTTDESTNAKCKYYVGFDTPTLQQTTINGEGNTVLDIYYPRIVYTISAKTDGGTISELGQYKYGQQITLSAKPYKGYKFLGWISGDDNYGSNLDLELRVEKDIYFTPFSKEAEYDNFVLRPSFDEYYIIGVENKNVDNIIVPNSVNGITIGAFKGCESLTSITLPFVGGHQYPFLGYIFGTFFGRDNSSYVPSTLKEVIISEGCTYIAYDAFYGCSSLTSVTIPNSVTSIGDDAFSGCSSLTSITIPASITSIGSYAFYGCSSLNSINVDVNNVVYDSRNNCNAIIETETNTLIVGCDNTIIPASITSIGSYAFSGCLTSLTIPSNITSIGRGAFAGCNNLTSITLPFIGNYENNNSLRDFFNNVPSSLKEVIISQGCTIIGEKAFLNCSSVTSITIPASVTSIGDDAFKGCSSVTSITIPASVTSIGYGAFKGCESLTSITLPFVGNGSTETYLGYIFGVNSYKYNSSYVPSTLEEVIISEGCKSIDSYAFYGCSSLTSITIPASVTSIGYGAFNGCESLTSITIPASITSIGSYAFYGCSSLNSINVDVNNVVYDSRNNCNAIIETKTNTLIVGCDNTIIPASITSIGSYATSR